MVAVGTGWGVGLLWLQYVQGVGEGLLWLQ